MVGEGKERKRFGCAVRCMRHEGDDGGRGGWVVG